MDDSSTLRGLAPGETILAVRYGIMERPFLGRSSTAHTADGASASRIGAIARVIATPFAEAPAVLDRRGGSAPAGHRRLRIDEAREIRTRSVPSSIPVADTSQGGMAQPLAPTLTITHPASTSLEVGDTIRLGVASGPDGDPIAVSVRWTSSDSTVGRVDAITGLVMARENGIATIEAAAGASRDTVTLRVVEPIVATLLLSRIDSLVAGVDTGSFVVARSASGRRLPRPPALRWISSQPAIASIDSGSGRIHARSPGAVRIEVADISGATASRVIMVTQPALVVRVDTITTKPDTAHTVRPLPSLETALGPASACRDAYLSLDQAAITQLGRDGGENELVNQRSFLKHLTEGPRVDTVGSKGPVAEGRQAEVIYEMRMKWRPSGPLRKSRNEPLTLRAVLAGHGASWELIGCHLVHAKDF